MKQSRNNKTLADSEVCIVHQKFTGHRCDNSTGQFRITIIFVNKNEKEIK